MEGVSDRRGTWRCWVGVALAIGVLVSLLLGASAQAKTRTVGTTKDKGPHSLRKTIKHAHPGETVKLPKGTYELRKGEIAIKHKLKVKGAGAGKTKLTAGRRSRIFTVTSAASPVLVSKLKLTKGKADAGGAIANAGRLKLSKVKLVGNKTKGPHGWGGAIANSGRLTVDRSTLRGNTANTGGAIAAGLTSPYTSEPVRIKRSRVIGNRATSGGSGGAIFFLPTSLSGHTGLFVTQSTIAHNKAIGTAASGSNGSASGGGIDYEVIDDVGITSALKIDRSTISGNSAIAKAGYAAYGGGVYYQPILNQASAVGALSIVNSTISGNAAKGPSSLGGGVFQQAVANSGSQAPKQLTNVTLVGNSASDGSAGGLYFTGISAVFQPVPTVNDSIIAGNSSSAVGTSDCFEAANSGGYNLEGHSSCGLTRPGDLQSTAAGLKPLAANGGPTETRALKGSSPAVNAGNPNGCQSTDQRGVKRPRRGRCDIGAYELKP